MEFRQVQYFVCLFEEGSVTRAARRLNIVQPALSMQVAKLEEELGQALFIRSPQGMQPTPAGREMYRLFLPVLSDFARARDAVMHTDGELGGQVQIGLIATLAQGVMAEALDEFTTAHPKVSVAITDGYSGGLADAVAGGQLDAAIINKPRRPLALNTQPIVDEDLLLVTGPRHAPLPARVAFRKMSSLKLVLPTRRHGLRGIIESFALAEDVQLAPSVEIDAISAIVSLVQTSGFATLLPRIAVRPLLASHALTGHAVFDPKPSRHLVCLTHPTRPLNPAAAAFLAVLLRHVRELGAAPAAGRPGAMSSAR